MAHETFDFRKSIRLLEGRSDAIEELFIVSIPNCILMAMTTTRSLNIPLMSQANLNLYFGHHV